jgi:Fe-S oxidoreductase
MRVSLFVTCLAEMFYKDVAKDVVEVLERLGVMSISLKPDMLWSTCLQ